MHNQGKKILVFMLVLSLLFTATGCSPWQSAWLRIQSAFTGRIPLLKPDADGLLSDFTLMQGLIMAVKSDNDVANVYESIPSRQLDGVTLDQFQQYISLLRHGINGDIHAFTAMDSDENAAVREDMVEQLPEQKDLIGQAVGYIISFRESGKNDEQFTVFLHQDNSGHMHLSSAWIDQLLNMANYASLYFDAIDRQDSDALTFLLDANPAEDEKAVLQARANRLIDFYKNNISSRTSEYWLVEARIDRLTYEQYNITNPDRSQAVSRLATFNQDADGLITADDVITDVLNDQDLTLLLGDQQIFQIGAVNEEKLQTVRSVDLEQIIGSPLTHTDAECVLNEAGKRVISLQYPDAEFSIVAEGTCTQHRRWTGFIRSVSLTGSQIHLASGLAVGQSVHSLLLLYPFAAEVGYRLRGSFAGGVVTMAVTIEKDVISQIDLTLIPTVAP